MTGKRKILPSAKTLKPCIAGDIGTPDVVIVIPARNEAARITRCLNAIASQQSCDHLAIAVILVVNNTDDETVRIAHHGKPACLALCTISYDDRRGGNVGLARRLGFEFAFAQAPRCETLLTTDADCEVADDWVSTAVSGLRRFDALCGQVQLITLEARALPPVFFERGGIEHDYLQVSMELCHLLAPDPTNPFPHHGQCAGANLAFRASAYGAIGGFHPIPLGEDRDITRRLKLDGYRVRHSEKLLVNASCRLSGRATGGMADAIRTRIGTANPSLDSALFSYRDTVALYQREHTFAPVWPPAAQKLIPLAADEASRDFSKLQDLVCRLRDEPSVAARHTVMRSLALAAG
ncbi:glycosyltransferase [Roseobacter litoralis]|uniref:glycosyltransferase n=1 Tax=Roseobacter litoralis TaxID=42443 RepID=UPI0024916828|nr:glycosyltransferase family 2 protein [Roseobacter litoralis]